MQTPYATLLSRRQISMTAVLRKAVIGLGFVALGVAMFVWGVVMPFMGLFYTLQLLS